MPTDSYHNTYLFYYNIRRNFMGRARKFLSTRFKLFIYNCKGLDSDLIRHIIYSTKTWRQWNYY
jgi:hypothetical protein